MGRLTSLRQLQVRIVFFNLAQVKNAEFLARGSNYRQLSMCRRIAPVDNMGVISPVPDNIAGLVVDLHEDSPEWTRAGFDCMLRLFACEFHPLVALYFDAAIEIAAFNIECLAGHGCSGL